MNGRPRRRVVEDEDLWLLSFADLVTLLLGFFVLLYAASASEGDAYRAIADSLRELVDGEPARTAAGSIASLATQMDRHIDASGLSAQVELRHTPHGLEVTAASSLLFAPGSAILDQQARHLLDTLAALLIKAPDLVVRVEGHTDDTPIQTSAYPSNWELSAARAVGVVRHLIGHGVTPQRLSAAGYADTRPAVQDAGSEQQRARNRRVVLLIQRIPRPSAP